MVLEVNGLERPTIDCGIFSSSFGRATSGELRLRAKSISSVIFLRMVVISKNVEDRDSSKLKVVEDSRANEWAA